MLTTTTTVATPNQFSDDFDWGDLILPGERLRAYGRDWYLGLFTGRLVEKEANSESGTARFIDGKARGKRIDLFYTRDYGRQHVTRLYEDMTPGDTLSMAYFSNDTATFMGPWCFVYDHRRATEHSDARTAVLALRYFRTVTSWLEPWTWNMANRFEGTDQFRRLRSRIKLSAEP